MGVLVTDFKLDFWLEHDLNVLFTGHHGVGKTAMVCACFERYGLVKNEDYLYFSAATLDPWVDFIGVPKEVKDDDGISYLEMILPKRLAKGKIKAIFLDEFNRCISGDTKIPLLDGSLTKIKDLVEKDSFYVYSYDTKLQKIVIGRGHSARCTLQNQQLIKITLDNGQCIRCTLDHPIMTRNGEYKIASDLVVGESLMPLHRRINNRYEQVLQPNRKNNKWQYTHWLSDEFNLLNNKYCCVDERIQRHHLDKNTLNNIPENIIRVHINDHLAVYRSSDGGTNAHKNHPDLSFRSMLSKEGMKKAHTNSAKTRQISQSYKKIRSELSKNYFSTDGAKEAQANNCKNGWENGQFDFNQTIAHEKMYKTKCINFGLTLITKGIKLTPESYSFERSLIKGKGNAPPKLEKLLSYFGTFDNYLLFVQSKNNHKIVSIELDGVEDVYDMTVDNYHNFATECGVFVHNSPSKVRNAVMELQQFKSINGRLFPNLKVIWAAQNPVDEEETYNVEKIDPAQDDRFHVRVEIPYRPSVTYFTKVYGPKIASGSIEWWNGLPAEVKKEVSPRRLEYALKMHKIKGDLHDILPDSCGIKKLLYVLESEPVEEVLKKYLIQKNKDAAIAYLSNENHYEMAINHILKQPNFREYFLPLIPSEKLSCLMSEDKALAKYVVVKSDSVPIFKQVTEEILQVNSNKPLCAYLNEVLKTCLKNGPVITIPPHFSTKPSDHKPWAQQLAMMKNWPMGTPQYRNNAYDRVLNNVPAKLTWEEVKWTLDVINNIFEHSFPVAISTRMKSLVGVVNHCANQLSKSVELGWYDIIEDLNSKGAYNSLISKIQDAGFTLPEKVVKDGDGNTIKTIKFVDPKTATIKDLFPTVAAHANSFAKGVEDVFDS